MSQQHFKTEYLPVPRRGFTPIEAAEYLKQEFPHIACWTLMTNNWRPLSRIVGKGRQTSGTIGTWKWAREKSSYPEFAYWNGLNLNFTESDEWVGVLKITGATGEEFLIFSFMDSRGAIGECYMFSTLDAVMIDRFLRDTESHFIPKGQLTIDVWGGGPDIHVDRQNEEQIFLADELRQDIETQVYSFFRDASSYGKLKVSHRRGFLFVGSPGNGKTMFLRHLIRECHLQYKASPVMLSISNRIDDGDVRMAFGRAARRAPSLLIVEDLDSLTQDCKVSRSALLAELDGLDQKDGILVIGTTNHPEHIDPALIHRPSRFDRVWHFPLPDQAMRLTYLKATFPEINDSLLQGIAEDTTDWSFAYLNELRTTAAILCMGRNDDCFQEGDLEKAHELLTAQFREGRKNHAVAGTTSDFGFKAA